MQEYNAPRAHYGEVLRQILEEDVPTHEPPSQAGHIDASEAVPRSESVGEPHATEEGLLATRAKLRAEAASWGIAASEIEPGMTHHPLAAARSLLWKARRQQTTTTLLASTAD